MKITGTAAISFFNSTICTIGLSDVDGTSATSDCLVEVETDPVVVVVGAWVVVVAGLSGLLWKKEAMLSKASRKMLPDVVVSGA